MTEWLNSLTGMETMYLICAVLGGLLFLLRIFLMIIGFDHGPGDVDAHTEFTADLDSADGAADILDSDASFSLLSLQGVMGFFLMFGMVGLGMSKETDLGNLKSFLGASVAGIIAMYLTAKIFQAFMNLQSSGTLNLNNAIGQEGLIYLTIPGGERGKVQVVIQDSQKIFDAVSADGSEIKTGAQVKVTKVVSGNVMVVEKL